LAKNPEVAGAQTPQLFVARQNMSTPPQFTQVGSQGVADSTANISINCAQGLESTISLTATDSEGDALTYDAEFLKDGMDFTSPTLTWTPTAAPGTVFNVVFYATTPSGGTDAIVASLTVTGNNLVQRRGAVELARKTSSKLVEFQLAAGNRTTATLEVFDVLGRRICRVQPEGAGRIGWDGTDGDGRRVRSGIYLYRLVAGSDVRTGRVAVLR
jgi:hypothetical protein